MNPISLDDIAGALAHCDPEQLAAAFAEAGAESVTHAARALEKATDLIATYPTQEVVAEADALLDDVLRWPIADAVPGWERLVTPQSYAARRGIDVDEAAASLDRLRDTEVDAARALLGAGRIASYTLEQCQVTDCIEKLVISGEVPTRDSVRRLALDFARAAMGPGDGDSPIVYSIDEHLAPRILSPSPKVHAVLWLQQRPSEVHSTGVIADRISYLSNAARAMGTSAREHARVMALGGQRFAQPTPVAATMPAAASTLGLVG